MIDKETQDLFLGYLEGELDTTQTEKFEALMAQDPRLEKLVLQVIQDRSQLRAIPQEQAPPSIMDTVSNNLERAMLLDHNATSQDRTASRRKIHISKTLSYAAVAAMLFLVVGVAINQSWNSNYLEQSQNTESEALAKIQKAPAISPELLASKKRLERFSKQMADISDELAISSVTPAPHIELKPDTKIEDAKTLPNENLAANNFTLSILAKDTTSIEKAIQSYCLDYGIAIANVEPNQPTGIDITLNTNLAYLNKSNLDNSIKSDHLFIEKENNFDSESIAKDTLKMLGNQDGKAHDTRSIVGVSRNSGDAKGGGGAGGARLAQTRDEHNKKSSALNDPIVIGTTAGLGGNSANLGLDDIPQKEKPKASTASAIASRSKNEKHDSINDIIEKQRELLDDAKDKLASDEESAQLTAGANKPLTIKSKNSPSHITNRKNQLGSEYLSNEGVSILNNDHKAQVFLTKNIIIKIMPWQLPDLIANINKTKQQSYNLTHQTIDEQQIARINQIKYSYNPKSAEILSFDSELGIELHRMRLNFSDSSSLNRTWRHLSAKFAEQSESQAFIIRQDWGHILKTQLDIKPLQNQWDKPIYINIQIQQSSMSPTPLKNEPTSK